MKRNVPDNLKELCRYGTFLTVRIPSSLLNEECDPMGRFDGVRQALSELKETDWIDVLVSDYGEETEIQVSRK